ncbi:hypothetical protein MWN34_11930 [Ancylobacter sp. 6x-1]|uniref:Uncharacterized protein n=1 Tax=Ancylobacter crimeensis TaxID=2579147 RepID=A0ABT0DCD5_9HYPH|nr:hypothetical protein [Ancylobacter crimeensis]MCK0197621.1 hypothetical protein [Ancylobacter crimeensis]
MLGNVGLRPCRASAALAFLLLAAAPAFSAAVAVAPEPPASLKIVDQAPAAPTAAPILLAKGGGGGGGHGGGGGKSGRSGKDSSDPDGNGAPLAPASLAVAPGSVSGLDPAKEQACTAQWRAKIAENGGNSKAAKKWHQFMMSCMR